MEFSKEDIEAVAKDRIMRSEGKKSTYISWAMMICMIIGFAISWKVNNIAGYVIVGVAIIGWLWYTNQISKKQKLEKWRLVKLYNEEKSKITQEVK